MACSGLLLGFALGGCDSPSHENLDKWMRTKNGPDKLRAALSDSKDPDLAAHAAFNLLRKKLDSEVKPRLEKLPPERRAAVIEKLVPRLWDMARVEGEMTVPNGDQALAKDLLVDVRELSTGAARAQIDGYLLDWYTSGFYDARAQPGRYPGASVVRTLGSAAGERLIPIVDSILAKALVGAERLRVSDELLLGIAASGSPASVKYLLDLAAVDRGDKGDKTLGKRAISALYRAYVDPGGLFPVAEPAALVPHAQTLVGFAKSDQEGQVINDAIALVRATGKPTCLEPLVAVVAYPHSQVIYRYIGASAALQCGGASAIAPVLAALPDNASYSRQQLGGSVWTVIAKLDDRAAVLEALRAQAKGERRLGKWVAIEALAMLRSTEDLALIQSMQGDRRKLTGFWGNQEDVPVKDRKAEPTLGARAQEIANDLQAGAAR